MGNGRYRSIHSQRFCNMSAPALNPITHIFKHFILLVKYSFIDSYYRTFIFSCFLVLFQTPVIMYLCSCVLRLYVPAQALFPSCLIRTCWALKLLSFVDRLDMGCKMTFLSCFIITLWSLKLLSLVDRLDMSSKTTFRFCFVSTL